MMVKKQACSLELPTWDNGEFTCDDIGTTCSLKCKDGFKQAMCAENGFTRCNCLGNNCYWTNLGRQCHCKNIYETKKQKKSTSKYTTAASNTFESRREGNI